MTQPHNDTIPTPNMTIQTTTIHSLGSAGTKPRIPWSDSAGLLASIGCAIHCAAMPFVIGYLPALGLSFLADEAFHKWMAFACFAIALAAFVPGFRRHGHWTPIVIGAVGLAMISIAAFGFPNECCSACATPTNATTTDATPTAATPVVATTTCEGCSNDCCPATAATAATAESPQPTLAAASASSPPAWLVRILPWITPLGGVVLVVAHLLNHRSGCQSGCC